MNARLHHDLAEFTALTRPLLAADPIRHSIALTVLARLSRVPAVAAGPPVLLSVHRDGVLVGAAVYTPPRFRGHGYGSAVTAAAAGWARQAGAKHVVLFTDLANPVSHAIYPRIGFRPVHDAVEIAFTPAP